MGWKKNRKNMVFWCRHFSLIVRLPDSQILIDQDRGGPMFELEGYLQNFCWGDMLRNSPFFPSWGSEIPTQSMLGMVFSGAFHKMPPFFSKKHPRNQNKVAKQKCMPTLSITTKQTQTWSLLLGCWWIRSRIEVADCLPVMLLGSIRFYS